MAHATFFDMTREFLHIQKKLHQSIFINQSEITPHTSTRRAY